MQIYDANGELKFLPSHGRPVTVWFHNESIFYAHDQQGSNGFTKTHLPSCMQRGTVLH